MPFPSTVVPLHCRRVHGIYLLHVPTAPKCGNLVFLLPGGVQAMSGDVEGLVETSLNMGQLSMKKDALNLGFSLRSSIETAKYMLEEKV